MHPSKQICSKTGPLAFPAVLTILLGVGASLFSTGCYQRVVKDTSGNYIGQIHEPNLPDDERGFWSDQPATTTEE